MRAVAFNVKPFKVFGTAKANDFSWRNQFDFSLVLEFLNFLDRIKCAAKLIAAVNQSDFGRYIGQENTPIQRRITATGNDHAFVTEFLGVLDEILDAFAFIEFDVFNQGLA